MATRKNGAAKKANNRRKENLSDKTSREASSEIRRHHADSNRIGADGSSVAAPTVSHGSGDYIILNGKQLDLDHHPTDFSVIGSSATLENAEETSSLVTRSLSASVKRASVKDAASRDALMNDVRDEAVAHHIYQVRATGEEIVIDNRLFLTLRHSDPEELEEIINTYRLVPEGRMGNAYVLRVSEATGMNPLKAANEIAMREGVLSCSPQLLAPMQLHQTGLADTHRLFGRQWYLTSELLASPDLHPTAGIRAPEAWRITTGSPDVVVAVIDDGFDLDHPAFLNKRIHTSRRDFAVMPQDPDAHAERGDYHGTSVASIATGSFDGAGMVGVAPGCTFLPIRIGFGPMAAPVDILDVFRYVSQHADVVNCSFGTPPRSFDPFHPEFRNAITELTRSGGRRGKGLVMVFSAANDDAPTFLRGAKNVNGVSYVENTAFGSRVAQVPAGQDVFSGYPLTRGVIVVGALSSLKRKSGYSNWGAHLTVTAPSNNMHYIPEFIRRGENDTVRDRFVANYRGLGQIAAINRPGKGDPFSPLRDDPTTPDFDESHYTGTFGGTSGAAPVVTGVVALMLSVNPALTATQVRQILMATADRDLDPTLDLPNDPNLQGLTGVFVNGHSPFFGAGKIDALRAVERAQALFAPSPASAPHHALAAHHTRKGVDGNRNGHSFLARAVAAPTLATAAGEFEGKVNYGVNAVRLRMGSMSPVLIEHRDNGDYIFERDAPDAQDAVMGMGKQEGDSLIASGDLGSLDSRLCLFYTDLF